MAKSPASWQVAAPPDDDTRRLAAALSLPIAVARALQNRGLDTPEAADRFLHPSPEHAHDPFRMADMDVAVARLATAAGRRERVLVYGDYDVDGLTATALLYSFLRRTGQDVDFFIPHRLEQGYGLHAAEIERAAARGVRLIVTVDTGISAAVEVERARALGVDVIVADHHEPPAELPAAVAVCNPRRPDCPYPEKELCGAAVAFKLCQAIAARTGAQDPWDLVDLVALGAIADVVPLQGENRVLVALGLRRLNERMRPGIAELLLLADVRQAEPSAAGGRRPEPLTAERVSFTLAPRLNAVGRMGRIPPGLGVELLLAEGERAAELARGVAEENEFRIRVEREVLAEAAAAAERDLHLPAIALAGENWHPGVLGIVAARLQQRFRRPTLIVGWGSDGDEGRGSARAGGGFDLPRALQACSDTLLRYGGHAAAAGLSIARQSWDTFRERFLRHAEDAAAQAAAAAEPLLVEAEIAAGEFTVELARAVEAMQPFGAGNPAPRFLLRGLLPVQARTVGKDSAHLMLQLQGSRGERVEGIGFGLAALWDDGLARASGVDVVVTPALEQWRGRPRFRARFVDLAPGAPAAMPSLAVVGHPRPSSPAAARPQAGSLVDWRGDHGRPAAVAAAFREWPRARGIVASAGSLARWRRALGEPPVAITTWMGAGMIAASIVPTGSVARAGSDEDADGAAFDAPHILLDPPPSRDALRDLAGRAAAGGQPLVLCFGRSELPVSRRALEAIAPDREALADVYRGLRAAAGAGRLVRRGDLAPVCPRVPEETLIVAWSIFSELGLLVSRGQGEAEFVAPPGRLNLEQSPTYAGLSAMREEFPAFGQFVTDAPVDEIWQRIGSIAAS